MFHHIGFFVGVPRLSGDRWICEQHPGLIHPWWMGRRDRPFTVKGDGDTGFQKRNYTMKSFSKCASAMVAIVLLAGMASATDTISSGKVKAIHSDKKEFVLTDAAGKDWRIKLGNNVVINRGGKETAGDLNENDTVNVCYDKGTFTWTAHYILVQEGNSKNWKLMHGTFKGYDPDKKLLSFTDEGGTDLTFGWGDGHVRLNKKDAKVEKLKIGDKTLIIVEANRDTMTLKAVMVE